MSDPTDGQTRNRTDRDQKDHNQDPGPEKGSDESSRSTGTQGDRLDTHTHGSETSGASVLIFARLGRTHITDK